MSKLLVVIDVQNDFISGALGSVEAQKIVPNIVEKIKNWDGPIIATFDTHTDDTYKSTIEGQKLPIKHCIVDTDGWFVPRDLSNAYLNHGNQTYSIRKNTFGDIRLCETIKQIEKESGTVIDEIELIGLCTDICVISNALILRSSHAYKEITVDASCCAGSAPEKHLAAIEVMKSCLINVVNE